MCLFLTLGNHLSPLSWQTFLKTGELRVLWLQCGYESRVNFTGNFYSQPLCTVLGDRFFAAPDLSQDIGWAAAPPTYTQGSGQASASCPPKKQESTAWRCYSDFQSPAGPPGPHPGRPQCTMHQASLDTHAWYSVVATGGASAGIMWEKKGYCPAWLQLQDECKGDGQWAVWPLGSPMPLDMCGASVHGCVVTEYISIPLPPHPVEQRTCLTSGT